MITTDSPILLVDDSLAIRLTLRNILTAAGYTDIQEAGNGQEALAKIKEADDERRMYHMIFLDWNMPEMDGFELLTICRNELNLKNVAIIMLTAVSDQKSLVKALSSGATSYITKPVAAETIIKRIEEVGKWLEAREKSA